MPNELAKALAAFHAELPEVKKGSVNPAFKSKYADLADIVKVVLPKLAAQGLAWTATPRITEQGFVLAYQLMHTSGESIAGEWPLPDPSQATPQQLGSATTYAKRFTLSAVTGIAPDDDDDGAVASAKNAPRATRPAPASERIPRAIAAMRATDSRDGFDRVWQDVIRSGLNGIPDVVAVFKELDAKYPPSTVDHWAVVEPGTKEQS